MDRRTPIEEDIAIRYKKFKSSPKFNLSSEEVFCTCRQPDHDGELMVLCSGCDEWFHFKCMKLNKDWLNLISEFFCIFCEWQQKGNTKWKRRCRMFGCYEPVRQDLKYCSDEHGLAYMKQILLRNNQISKNDTKQVFESAHTVEELRKLGLDFPELNTVVEFRKDGNVAHFPEETRRLLEQVNAELVKVEAKTKVLEEKQGYFTKVKENVKAVNDKLASTMEVPTKNKKKGQKKIDICLYDRDLEHHHVNELLEDFDGFAEACKSRQEDGGADWYRGVCVRERKKCMRHNGWWNLAVDQIAKELVQLAVARSDLEEKREGILRGYSVGVYEGREEEKKEEVKEEEKEEEKEEVKEEKKEEEEKDEEMKEDEKKQDEENSIKEEEMNGEKDDTKDEKDG